MTNKKMAAEREHLRNKIEIIHNYNASYVPDFTSLSLIEDDDRLDTIYNQALAQVRLENYSKHRRMMDTVLPLFKVVEERSHEPSTLLIANFMLMTVQETIKSHHQILSQISSRNNVEEKCLQLCHDIANLHQENAIQFFSLFKEYLTALIENHDKITRPLSFERNGIQENPLLDSQCLII